MKNKRNAIVLCSGGLDSVVTANYVKKKLDYSNLKILFFNYGQRTLKQEKIYSRKCSSNLKVEFIEIKLDELNKISTSLINSSKKVREIDRKELKDTKKESDKFYVPMRNTIFLVYALALAESILIKHKEASDIFVGFKNEGKEAYPDTTAKFVEEINKLQKITINKNIKIISPLIKMDKEDIIKLGSKLGVNFKDTFSCYSGTKNTNLHCGKCLACMLRKEGFYWSGLKDPTNYT